MQHFAENYLLRRIIREVFLDCGRKILISVRGVACSLLQSPSLGKLLTKLSIF